MERLGVEDRGRFNSYQLATAKRAKAVAAGLVTEYYRIAPREWVRMPYEVKTLKSLASSEVVDHALAQTLCYRYKRAAGPIVLAEGEIYRICLQDHRILRAVERTRIELKTLLTYVLTHELVHVVRFGQSMQQVDLPEAMRHREEQAVEDTTRKILCRGGYGMTDLFPDDSRSPAIN